MDIKTIKTLEEKFDKKFCNSTPFEDWKEVGSLETKISYCLALKNIKQADNIKSFYRSAIKDLLIECVGENETLEGNFNGSDPNDISLLSKNNGYNQAKSEIRSRILKMFEEK